MHHCAPGGQAVLHAGGVGKGAKNLPQQHCIMAKLQCMLVLMPLVVAAPCPNALLNRNICGQALTGDLTKTIYLGTIRAQVHTRGQ
jgi:hypothetical protein